MDQAQTPTNRNPNPFNSPTLVRYRHEDWREMDLNKAVTTGLDIPARTMHFRLRNQIGLTVCFIEYMDPLFGYDAVLYTCAVPRPRTKVQTIAIPSPAPNIIVTTTVTSPADGDVGSKAEGRRTALDLLYGWIAGGQFSVPTGAGVLDTGEFEEQIGLLRDYEAAVANPGTVCPEKWVRQAYADFYHARPVRALVDAGV